MKSWIAHYRNKYPKGSVQASDSAIDVYDAEGGHRVALRKNGANQMVCVSEELGCIDRHDLSPIPKDARVHKLYPSGMIGLSEEHEERQAVAEELAAHEVGGPGKVPSIQELHVAGNPEASKTSGFSHDAKWSDLKEKTESGLAASAASESSEEPAKKKKKHQH
jgi:hypothetical protein